MMKSNKHTQSMRNLLKLFQSACFELIACLKQTIWRVQRVFLNPTLVNN